MKYEDLVKMSVKELKDRLKDLNTQAQAAAGKDLDALLEEATTITSFAIGAACGGHLTTYFSYRTIWISCGILILCFLLMLIEEEEDLEVLEKKERKELE